MARNDAQSKATPGMITANTANNKLDGSGTLVTLLVAGESTTINKVVIKASVNTTEGMVRLFVEKPGKTIKLPDEVTVAARDQSGTTPTISQIVNFPKGFVLKRGWKPKASTENAETFNLFAECLEWNFPASETKVLKVGVTSMEDISTANSSLDGTGAIGTVATGALNGTRLSSLSIKAVGNTDNAMIRLFIKDDGGTIKLQREMRVPESKQTKVVPAYGRKIYFDGGLSLPAGYSLMASTERGDLFKLIAEGCTWEYKPA